MLTKIYALLSKHYGDLNWWPAKSPYEVMVGAILTQNTAWTNVEKALANFGGKLSPPYIAKISGEKLSEIIRPAGFFRQKTVYLKAITKWFAKYNYSVKTARKKSLEFLRAELLAVKGVGAETADSILLYALNLPSFVVDAYTKRLLTRLNITTTLKYDELKNLFEKALPRDVKLYNQFHALIVMNAKEHCRKKPVCVKCPLTVICLQQ